MSRQLIVSPEAEKDILTVLEYTVITWGEKQAGIYGELLNNGLLKIADNPNTGRARLDISPKHRCFLIEKHIAIYFFDDEFVYLSRLFHHSRDITRHQIP